MLYPLVTCPPVWLPMKNTRSASQTAWFAQSREYEPGTPTANGWSWGNIVLALRAVATGMESFSARAMSSARAPEAVTPPPATMMGRLALASSWSASVTTSISASGRKVAVGKGSFDNNFQIRLTFYDCLTGETFKIQMYGAWCAEVAERKA